jgi:CspA family cold shock protein
MANRISGTVKFYSREKRFGFIARDDGGEDVFLPGGECERADFIPGKGDKIEFEIDADNSGRPRAMQISALMTRVGGE